MNTTHESHTTSSLPVVLSRPHPKEEEEHIVVESPELQRRRSKIAVDTKKSDREVTVRVLSSPTEFSEAMSMTYPSTLGPFFEQPMETIPFFVDNFGDEITNFEESCFDLLDSNDLSW